MVWMREKGVICSAHSFSAHDSGYVFPVSALSGNYKPESNYLVEASAYVLESLMADQNMTAFPRPR